MPQYIHVSKEQVRFLNCRFVITKVCFRNFCYLQKRINFAFILNNLCFQFQSDQMELVIIAFLLLYRNSFVLSSYVNRSFGDCENTDFVFPAYACGNICLETFVNTNWVNSPERADWVKNKQEANGFLRSGTGVLLFLLVGFQKSLRCCLLFVVAVFGWEREIFSFVLRFF